MTTTREEFEAWFSDGLPAPLRRNGEEYVFVAVQSAWDAWQAAHLAGQRAMQERVKTVCALSMIDAALDRRREAEAGRVSQTHEKLAAAIRALEVKP